MSFYWITEKRRRELERERKEADRILHQVLPKLIKALKLRERRP